MLSHKHPRAIDFFAPSEQQQIQFPPLLSRSSWRVISSIEQKTESSARKQQLAREYRERVEKELREICYEVLVSFTNFKFHSRLEILISVLIVSRDSWTNSSSPKQVIQKAKSSTWKWRAIITDIWLRLQPAKLATVSDTKSFFSLLTSALVVIQKKKKEYFK